MSQQAQVVVQAQQKTAERAAKKGSLLQHAAVIPTITPVHSRLLQRCSGGVECEECRQKRLGMLQRAAVNAAPLNENGVPPIVHDTLNSPGQALDAGTRAFMEPRFGYDFSQVRVHTDARAAESARAVNALAYTVGRDVVFGTGMYGPGTSEGRRLLAHELTHVVQQKSLMSGTDKLSQPSDLLEKVADNTADSIMNGGSRFSAGRELVQPATSAPTIFRKVVPRLAHCPAGINGAPADPIGDLTLADSKAESFATLMSVLLAIDSALTRSGFRNPAADTQKAYEDHFGLPPAQPGGFLNRLTGAIRPTQDVAIGEELQMLSRRFELIARTFNQILHYRCIGGASSFAGCAPTGCAGFLAWSCEGIDVIFLCPSFWTHGTEEQAAILIHEAAHINWGRVGDVALAGPGGNFRIADCYASFAADSMGTINPDDTCPVPPP